MSKQEVMVALMRVQSGGVKEAGEFKTVFELQMTVPLMDLLWGWMGEGRSEGSSFFCFGQLD